MSERRGGLLLTVFVMGVSAVVLLPIVVVLAASVTPQEFIEVPPSGLSLRWYQEILDDPDWAQSLALSGVIAVCVAALSTALGVPAALGLRGLPGRGGVAMQTFLLSPLMVPTIVIGLALLRWSTVLHIPLSPLAIVLGQTVIAIPYVVRLVLASLAGEDPALRRAAVIFGATPLYAFRRVTLPAIRQGVVAGILFCLIISLDDVNIALFLSDVQSTPLSVRLFGYITQNADPLGAAVATLLVLIAAALIGVCDLVVGLDWLLGLRPRSRPSVPRRLRSRRATG